MARYGQADVGFLLSGGFDLLGTTTQLEIDKEAKMEQVDGLGDSDEAHAKLGVGLLRVTQDGFYNDAANLSNAAMVGLAERVFCVGLEGNTLGKKFVGVEGALQHTYQRGISRDELHKANAAYLGSGKVEEGTIHHTHKAETADPGTETSQDNGTSSANGGSAYLQVSALTLGGYTSITMKIRDSTDDIAFVDLITMTTVTAVPTAERKTVTGTVNRYTRTTWDFIGSGSGQSCTFMMGFFRG